MNNVNHEELDAVCGNCNHSFPAEAGGSIFGICLRDPEFDPYIERLLENDFAWCAELIGRKRFLVDRQACSDFDPIEVIGDEAELSPELTADIQALVAKGQLTPENVKTALAAESFRRTDWSKAPTDDYVWRLHGASTVRSRDEALNL
jgi:hypothetical protein